MKTAHENRRDAMIDKFIKNGFDGLSPRGSLELLLCYAMPSVSMTIEADKLFERYSDLADIISIPPQKLMHDHGFDESAAVLLHILPDLVSRYKLSDRSAILETVNAAVEYFVCILRHETAERLVVCYLNSKLGIRRCHTIGTGDLHRTAAHPIELIKEAQSIGSRTVIIAHNHPAQAAQPSEDDIVSTRLLKRALNDVGIHLLDHIIVASDGSAVSMKNEGFFPLLDK